MITLHPAMVGRAGLIIIKPEAHQPHHPTQSFPAFSIGSLLKLASYWAKVMAGLPANL
jgi:hypothetical protein